VDQVSASLTHNCQPANPQFVAPASFDYHLSASSPCRDAGATVSPAATEQYVYDLGHEARPVIGSAPDAGAFEFVPDTDGDGLIDTHDACPTQSDLGALQNPRNGCPSPPKPRDSDGDGIADVSDACPSQSDATARRTPRNGCPATVNLLTTGTVHRDNLVGDSGRNELCGLLGNDRLSGAGGNDTLFGDACNVKSNGGRKDGNDTLVGGDGDDTLYGEGGNDSLDGGPGNDKLLGGAGNDRLAGGPGNDTLTGGPGINSYLGGPGDDVINARNGRKDAVDCGPGKHDLAIVDHADKVKGCERVKRSKH
ncbi:MAG: thrombospondin type 3 repeat-containing protein, partial [Solirubrobacteraceae bacterium]